MIFVPLPFVVALLLAILLFTMWRNRASKQLNWPFHLLITLCIAQSLAVGLRWGYGLTGVRYALPVIASALPPLLYASFRTLSSSETEHKNYRLWLIAIFPITVSALLFVAPILIDGGLILLFIAYAFALLYLGRSGPDSLSDARFETAISAHRALIIAAASLCMSAFFDVAILFDFEWTDGSNAALIVSNANLLGLFFLGLTAVVAGKAQPTTPHIPDTAANDRDTEQDKTILAQVERKISSEKLYLDENLTLVRLAKKVGLPTREISAAINHLTAKNVSQFINEFRINEACNLLRVTNLSVTAIVFESGFTTKSNFNREFRRVTGLSPLEWRKKQKPTTSPNYAEDRKIS